MYVNIIYIIYKYKYKISINRLVCAFELGDGTKPPTLDQPVHKQCSITMEHNILFYFPIFIYSIFYYLCILFLSTVTQIRQKYLWLRYPVTGQVRLEYIYSNYT